MDVYEVLGDTMTTNVDFDNDKFCDRCIYKDMCELTDEDVTYCLVRYLLIEAADYETMLKKQKN